jgi:arginase
MRLSTLLALVSLLHPGGAYAQTLRDIAGKVRVALVKMPYSGARNVAELSDAPEYLEAGGLADTLVRLGAILRPTTTVRLSPEEEREYGEWHRMGLANGHLAETVSHNRREGYLSIGLLANCTSLLGILGGLQHSGPSEEPLTVSLVFVDAHGDFNTPETTLSGMLGGMPVAVSAGLALTKLRLESGLDPALSTRHIVMAAVRDVDPLEQQLIDESDIQHISVDDIVRQSEHLHDQMRRLSRLTDVIYVHVDMDVLEPREVPGHSLSVPGGPTSSQLGAALGEIFRYDKVAALGIASTPSGARDPEGVSLWAAYRLIEGAVRGVQQRRPPR